MEESKEITPEIIKNWVKSQSIEEITEIACKCSFFIMVASDSIKDNIDPVDLTELDTLKVRRVVSMSFFLKHAIAEGISINELRKLRYDIETDKWEKIGD